MLRDYWTENSSRCLSPELMLFLGLRQFTELFESEELGGRHSLMLDGATSALLALLGIIKPNGCCQYWHRGPGQCRLGNFGHPGGQRRSNRAEIGLPPAGSGSVQPVGRFQRNAAG